MDTLAWQELEEKRRAWIDLMFRHAAGLEVDPAEMAAMSQAVQATAWQMIPAARQDPEAWRSVTANYYYSQLTPLEMELHQMQREHLVFTEFPVNGRPANHYSKFQYLNQEPDPAKRHAFLTRLMQGHPAVDEAQAHYHARFMELAAEWRNSPLDSFLGGEGQTLSELRQLLAALALALRPRFLAEFARFRQDVFGLDQGEPWEDMYTLVAGRWAAPAERVVPEFDPVAAVQRAARTMGFDPDRIHMDLEDRPYKRSGASAWFTRIPDDIRLMLKTRSRLDDPRLLYHEMGHALHFATIDPNLPFPTRNGFSFGVAETFSHWFESLLGDTHYLQAELGFDERAAAEMARFIRFTLITYVTWLAAESLCLLDCWSGGPLTLAKIGERYSDYMQQYAGLTVPPMAIRAQGMFISTLSLNGVGFVPAMARLGHLLDQLEAVRRDWWNSPEAAALVRGYMGGGRYPGFPRQMLDIAPIVARYGAEQAAPVP
jgi:hypothetical protein